IRRPAAKCPRSTLVRPVTQFYLNWRPISALPGALHCAILKLSRRFPRHSMLRFLAGFVFLILTTTALAKPRIEFEVLAEPGLASSTAAQQWSKALAELGVAYGRFRAPQPGERPEITATGKGNNAEYRIRAQLTSRAALVTSA